ncbi:MAG: threonine synthase, partial [Oscillospiraceae bacterium]|nr:threonine synthase [Oscillospiraceae bacterium]
MRYISTRGQTEPVCGAEAILRGLAPDGGLFVPEKIPSLPADFVERLTPLAYPARAAFVLSLFLPEFDGLEGLCREAYKRFDGPPAPLVRVGGAYILELFHGPTCAFKDMALQVLPLLINQAKALTKETRDIYILTATSGDTGKAALEGFRDVPGTRVLVFYPEEGVSEVQKLQMVTQEGKNVAVCAVRGDFDDAQ